MQKVRLITMLLLLLLAFQSNAQERDSIAVKDAASITEIELSTYINILASDSLMGRGTGQQGEQIAAEYLAKEFQALGLPAVNEGSYFQEVPLKKYEPGGKIVAGNETFSLLEDFVQFGSKGDRLELDSLLFCGYGMESDTYNDFDGMDIEGRGVIMLKGEPANKHGISYITGDTIKDNLESDFMSKTRFVLGKGASVVFYAVEDFETTIMPYKEYFASAKMSLDEPGKKDANRSPVFVISNEVAREMMKVSGYDLEKVKKKISKKGKPQSFAFRSPVFVSTVTEPADVVGRNVLGYIEGSDLKDEIVIITAHFDHLGTHDGKIFNGADDNASGTSGLLEIAEAFAMARAAGNGPRRSILIMPVTAEEKGLLGSQYYSRDPVFPLENTIVNLNIDMIGRHDKKHGGKPNYIYVIGADRLSQDLHDINEWANETYVGMDLDYTYNDKNDRNNYYERSDHFNFARKNIPVIFYFSGNHEDYHTETDTPEKIEYDRLLQRTRLVFFTAWHLANEDERPMLND
ncbi:MAG: M28 family peptidase [bacterium]